MDLMFAIMIGVLIFVLALYLRIYPRLKLKYYGVDTWYYLLYVEEFRKTKKIPVKLPYYLLDKEEQWYPPVFPMMLSIFPSKFLEKHQWLINPLIDCVQLLLLYIITFAVTKNFLLAMLSGIIYATTPTLISENTNLNSRSLASLIFTGVMLCLMGFVIINNNFWLIPIILGGAIMLLTHKMVAQNFVFVMLALTGCYRDVKFILILVTVFLTAVIISKGFYLKILKGHIEILKFWRKNLYNLRAHQVYDSNIYKKPEDHCDDRFHLPGIKGIKRYLKAIITQNNNWYSVFLLPFVFLFNTFSPSEKFYFYWVFWSYFLIVLVTFVPQLKFLGESYKYVKFTIFPTAILFSSIWHTNKLFYTILLIFLLLLNLKSIIKNYKMLNKNPRGNIGNELMEIINYLNQTSKEGIMAISNFSADAIAYFTRKKVCWGGHSSGWNRLQDWFPVLKKPIEYFFEKYQLNYLLIDTDYVNIDYLKLKNFSLLLTEGRYTLYEWQR